MDDMRHNLPTRPGPTLSVLLLVLGMIMSGTIGYFVIESGAPPAIVVFWRCALGAAALLVPIAARRGTRHEMAGLVTSRTGVLVAVSGVLLVANWVLIFTAYEHLSIGVATVVFHIEPFLLIGLGALFLGDRITGRTLAWATLGFSGIVLVAQPWTATAGELRGLMLGVALTLAAATLYAASIILVRHVQSQTMPAPSPLIITAIQLLAGAIITAPALALVPHDISGSGWAHISVLGLVNTALMYYLVYTAYPHLSTATIGVLSFLYPAAAVVVDLIAYGIIITVAQILGFTAIAGAGIGHVLTDNRTTSRRARAAAAN